MPRLLPTDATVVRKAASARSRSAIERVPATSSVVAEASSTTSLSAIAPITAVSLLPVTVMTRARVAESRDPSLTFKVYVTVRASPAARKSRSAAPGSYVQAMDCEPPVATTGAPKPSAPDAVSAEMRLRKLAGTAPPLSATTGAPTIVAVSTLPVLASETVKLPATGPISCATATTASTMAGGEVIAASAGAMLAGAPDVNVKVRPADDAPKLSTTANEKLTFEPSPPEAGA